MMNVNDDLSFVGSGVDYSKVAALDQKRLITFVNYFVSELSAHTNQFNNLVNDRLHRVDERLERVETSLTLLESKLNSIPWLEATMSKLDSQPKLVDAPGGSASVEPVMSSFAQPPISTESTSTETGLSTATALNKESQPLIAAPSMVSPVVNVAEAQADQVVMVQPVAPPAPASNVPTYRQHPSYAKFFKMLHMGIPEQAVRQKLLMEGMDPNIINKGDEPVPGADPLESSLSATSSSDDEYTSDDE